ncbi:MAG: hypothetical protein IPO42_02610 [Chitinophagaceae bacterium]|nr:hypothetical protein [Chitinophagaceae bacterium]
MHFKKLVAETGMIIRSPVSWFQKSNNYKSPDIYFKQTLKNQMQNQTTLQSLILLAGSMFQNKAYQLMPAYWAMVPVTHTVNRFGIK